MSLADEALPNGGALIDLLTRDDRMLGTSETVSGVIHRGVPVNQPSIFAAGP
jgi:hypothetical protein